MRATNQTTALFSPGQIVGTPAALRALAAAGTTPLPYLSRHVRGDWGDLDADDKKANESALRSGARILSAYNVAPSLRIWIITEATYEGVRQSICVLLPDEY